MADEEKKVSFGFSKIIKKSALQIPPKQETKKVDYIECLDEKAIRVVGEEEKKDEELVIPMLGSKTWCDRIMNKTDADIFEPKTKATENGEHSQVTNGNAIANGVEPMDVSRIKKEVPDGTDGAPKTLEEQAASEIIEDLKSKEIKVENPDLAVPITEDESLRGKQESTLEDYEQIPIDGFGLAVLRGMGWKPGKGIGKNEKLVAATIPELRPRGMGLGADKLTLQKQNNQPKTKEEEQLKIEKGSFVKVTTGRLSNNYGQIEGFDDDAGRLLVKMALSGETMSLNENVVQPVTKAEYAKNSKVLNATKFEEYKSKAQGKNGDDVATSNSDSSDDRETRSRRTEKSRSGRKKSKKRSKYSSDESDDAERRSRKRRSSSESGNEHKHRKSKKSKKSHRRDDSSSERSSRKNKRKDKEREKTRDRRTERPESSDRRQHKRHKRSRSRSPRRR